MTSLSRAEIMARFGMRVDDVGKRTTVCWFQRRRWVTHRTDRMDVARCGAPIPVGDGVRWMTSYAFAPTPKSLCPDDECFADWLRKYDADWAARRGWDPR